MKIVVAGGREEADFLIGSLLSKKIKTSKTRSLFFAFQYYFSSL